MKSDEILSGEITSVGSEPLMVKIVVRQDAYTIKVPKAGPLDPAVPTRPRREGPMRDYMAGAQAVIQIGPGGTAEVKSAHAKVAFRPERLTIPSSIGASCEILDFRTEGRSILKGTLERPVPAILFSEQAEAPIVDFGPVGPGGVVSMIVRNVGKQEVGVAFALMGPVVEEGQHEDVSDRATD